MKGQTATRLTCFALLAAIEGDLRRLLHSRVADSPIALLPEDVRVKAAERWEEDHPEPSPLGVIPDLELLAYCDFADLAKILHVQKNNLAHMNAHSATEIAHRLEALSAARNRVCHVRLLEPGDWADLYDFAQDLLRNQPDLDWSELRVVIAALERNPAFVLSLQIPRYWVPRTSRILSNLPTPDFDDTGFLGRDADRKALRKALLAAHPLITIVGEGGVGKTALALRCLHDLLAEASESDATPRFEAIVWTSLKDKVLTPEGARSIEETIGTTLGLAQSVATELGTPDVRSAGDLEGLFDEILQYLADFRVLLVIDNFETLTDAARAGLRPLFVSIPSGSKVLITSRVGLGELEYRYPIEGLDIGTASELMRKFARALNAKELSKAPEEMLRRYCELLYRNPLLVRWFVAAVHTGASPATLLDHDGDAFRSVIDYCFENLFSRLNPTERSVVHILSSARRPLSHAELLYLTRTQDRDSVEWALNVLHRSGIVSREHDRTTGPDASGNLTFRLSDIAGDYIAHSAPPPAELYAAVQLDLRQLTVFADSEAREVAFDKYKVSAIRHSSRDERIATYYLRRALESSGAGSIHDAREFVARAQQLTPAFSEVHRIRGVIEQQHGDTYQADLAYRAAIDLDKRSSVARYSYAQFLMKKGVEDFSGALGQLEQALLLDPHDDTLETARAWALTLLSRYPEAAELYETRVLIGLRSVLWKRSVRAQAAECYSRWSERDAGIGDRESFKTHLQRSLAILEQSFAEGQGTYDDLIRDLFVRIIDQGIQFAVSHKDGDYADALAGRLLAQLARYARRPIQMLAAPHAIRAFPTKLRVQKLNDVLNRRPMDYAVARARQSVGTRRMGAVDGVVRDKPYGFILDDDGIQWFFHRTALPDDVPWSRLERGLRVTFTVGRNPTGPCAIDITVGDSASVAVPTAIRVEH